MTNDEKYVFKELKDASNIVKCLEETSKEHKNELGRIWSAIGDALIMFDNMNPSLPVESEGKTFCPRCGQVLLSGFKFCGYCGKEIKL